MNWEDRTSPFPIPPAILTVVISDYFTAVFMLDASEEMSSGFGQWKPFTPQDGMYLLVHIHQYEKYTVCTPGVHCISHFDGLFIQQALLYIAITTFSIIAVIAAFCRISLSILNRFKPNVQA